MNPEQVKEHRKYELQKALGKLDEYVVLCTRLKVFFPTPTLSVSLKPSKATYCTSRLWFRHRINMQLFGDFIYYMVRSWSVVANQNIKLS